MVIGDVVRSMTANSIIGLIRDRLQNNNEESMNVIGLLGLPGAGKTTASEALVEYGESVEGIQMKQVAKECYDKVNEDGLDGFSDDFQARIEDDPTAEDTFCVTGNFGEEIGDWVDNVLNVDGTYFATRAVQKAQESTQDVCVVDGIRSEADAKTFTEEADNCVFYFLHCPFETRLKRLQDRGREGEEDFQANDLLDRDRQELSWGLRQILSDYQYTADQTNYESVYSIEYIPAMNHDSIEAFQEEVCVHFSTTVADWGVDC